MNDFGTSSSFFKMIATVLLCGFINVSCTLQASISELARNILPDSQFKLMPPSADITQGGVIQLNGENGTPPYTYEKVMGDGTLAPDGTFTSPSTSAIVMVKGTDSAGKVAFAVFNVFNRPELQPTTLAIAINNEFNFSVIGGKAPYTFRVIEVGRGTIASTGKYKAPATAGTATVEVEDTLGGKTQATVTVFDSLAISPTPLTIRPNTNQTFTTTGGVAPIHFAMESGGGTIDATTGVYTSPGVSGTSVVLAKDSLENEARSFVTIATPLQINPVALELIINSTFTFSATGGVPPYTYSLDAGVGTVAASTGIYTAPSAIGTAKVKVTDSLGTTSIASININLELSFTLPNILLLTNESRDLSTVVTGGVPPLNYSVSSGAGTIDSSTGVFTATNSPGSYIVTVTDNQGHQAQAALIIQPPMTISPTTPEIMAGTTLAFSASGGFAPYTYSVPSGGGGGGFSGAVFTAPATAQTVTVRATDSLGHTATTTVNVRGVLKISPTSTAVVIGQTRIFTGTDGIPPYTFSLTSGGGSLSAGGVYTAPATPSTAVVRLTDSQGNYVESNVRVLDRLQFTPSSLSMAKSSSLTLLATGGEEPYEYSILTGEGTINKSSGFFTASATAGTVSVQVKDALGNIATASIAVYESVLISPISAHLVINETQTFTASGGQAPYAYSLVSGDGAIDPTTGIYTAIATPGSAVVRVTDNLGQSSDATITVHSMLTLTPTSAQLAVNNTRQFTALGGVSPYSFTLQSGTGSITLSGLYTAPAAAGSAVVKVTDSGNRTATANVTVSAALTLSPSSLSLKLNETYTFTANQGVPPYTFSILSGTGTIDAGSGLYTSPSAEGSSVVRVTDSTGNFADSNVTTVASVEISPVAKSLALNEVFSFLALKGLPPYTYSKVSGGGTINASSGQFTAPAIAGTTVLRVTDSLSQTADATVTTYESVDLNPDTSAIAVNQTKVLSVTGGVGPYTYMLLSGTGSFNDGTMTYTAPATPTTAKIKVTDSLNNFDIATVQVVGPVQISPTTLTMIVSENATFTSVGGESPYSYSVVSGSGSINASSGVFTAASSTGVTVVRVTDNLGQTSDATITVDAALTISPTTSTLAVGNSQQFTAAGGVGPYTYSVTSGGGSVNASGLYTAGGSSGSATVRATDSNGRTADATVTIANALAISPTTKELTFGESQTFTASGGVTPYSYTVVIPGAGSVGVATGAYVAPNVAGTEKVRVTDSLGNIADATITIFGPVQISPTTKTLTGGETFVFSASGGKTPYTYSVSVGGGTINTSSGSLTASTTPGSYTVRVTDSLGQHSDSVLTIQATMDLTPDTSTIKVGQTQLLSLTNGTAPFNYSVISGTGTFDSGTMTYTASTTPTVASVQVTDNAGQTDTVTITVEAGLPSALYFVSSAQTVAAAACSGAVQVGVRDTYGNNTKADSAITVNLSATHITFYSDASCSSSITSRTISAGGTTTQFFFKSLVSGMDIVTAAATGLSSETQTESITAGALTNVKFSPATVTVLAGDCSSVSQLRLTDINNNPGTPSSNVSVSLTATGVTYYSDAACSSTVTSPVVLSSGTATQNLYFKKTLASSTTVTGAATGYTSGTLTLTVQPNVATKLVYLTQPSTSAWDNVAFIAQPQVGIYDQYDNFINTANSAITLAAHDNGTCTNAASGTLTASVNPLAATAGSSQFAGVKYQGVGTIYLKATAAGLTAACSNSIAILVDYSQSVSNLPSNIPADGLAEATLMLVPKKNGLLIGTGKTFEITSSSSTVTMTCNGSACGACQTPAATCVKAYDYGQGAYSINVKSSTQQTMSFTVRYNDSGTLSDLSVVNANFTNSFTTKTANSTITSGDENANLYLTGGTITFNATTNGVNFGDVFIRGATVTHTATSATAVNKLDVNFRTLTLQSGSIDVSSKGYTNTAAAVGMSYGPTAPSSTLASGIAAASDASGGSHGGSGGVTLNGLRTPGPTYDDYRDPAYPGGGFYTTGAGGGIARLNVTGFCTISSGATILANGGATYGRGAGGSIKLTCAGFTGTAASGAIQANGGSSTSTGIGSGGGGRVALIATGDAASFAGTFVLPTNSTKMTAFANLVQARSGTHTSAAYSGAAGTIYLKHSDLVYGGLIVHNGNSASTQLTALPSINNTAGNVSGSTLPLGTALSAGYVDLYKNMRLRPDISATNGTPTNLLDDNIVTISSNTLADLTINGNITSVMNGANLRTLEILDYLSVGGQASLTTGSDIVALNGSFTDSPALSFTDGSLVLTSNAASYPEVDTITLATGTYTGVNMSVNNLVVAGGTTDYTGVVTSNNITVNSGTFASVGVNATNLTLNGGASVIDNLNLTNNFTLNAGTLAHRVTTPTTVYRLEMNVGNEFKLLGGSIDVTSRGYTSATSAVGIAYGSTGPSSAIASGIAGGTDASGGSHGGSGGVTLNGLRTPGPTYGDYRNPYYPGGGFYPAASAGGGVVRITANNICTINSGASIVANGGTGGARGAGGSIKLTCAGFGGTAGTGAIQANGGASTSTGIGSGGGGRIALISTGNASTFTGSFPYPANQNDFNNLTAVVQARGGTHTTTAYNAAAGTIYLKHSGLTYGGLIVHNGALSSPRVTALPSINNTVNAVGAGLITMNSSLTTGYIDLYSSMRLRPDVSTTNGTPNNLLDDNIVTVNSNSLTDLTVTGSLAGVAPGATLRSIEILDNLNVGGTASLVTGSDLVILNGSFTESPDFKITDGSLSVTNGASSYPALSETRLATGTYYGTDLDTTTLTLDGGTASYTGTVNATTITVNSGNFAAPTTNVTNMTINGGTATIDTLTVAQDYVQSGGTLTHRATTATAVYRLEMNVGNEFKLLGGSIDATTKGYTSATSTVGSSYGSTAPSSSIASTLAGGTDASGGSHGGIGGVTSNGLRTPGAAYDDYRNPNYPGGGFYPATAAGGGVIRITASNNCTINSGATILANGSSSGARSAGGSIKMTCAGFKGTAASGAIQANGGASTAVALGSGGGGRVALISTGNESTFAGSFAFPNDSTKMTSFVSVVQSRAGTHTNTLYAGGAGTVYLKHSGLTYGGLIVHNGDQTTSGLTKAVSTTANTSRINSTVDANTLKVTSAATPFSTMVDIFKGYTIHVWPTATGNTDPLSNTHASGVITANAANTFVSSGSPFVSITAANDDHSYRIVNQLDALYVGGKATYDLQGSDLILTRSSGALACDFTNVTGGNFTVAAGAKLQGGNNYSSLDCPDSGFATKGTTVIFSNYCNGLGTCAP